MMKKILPLAILILALGVGQIENALAAQVSVPSAPTSGYFLVSTTTGNYFATTTDPIHAGSFFATSTATSTLPNTNITSLTIGALSGFLKQVNNIVTTALVNLAADVTGTLPAGNGGTASTTLGGILAGNGASGVKSAVIGSGLAYDGTTLSASGSSGITALGSGYASTTGLTITFSTSTKAFNGLTFGQTIIPSAGALLFTPTVTGTLDNTGLTNSSLTVTAGTGLSGGGSISLGGSATLNELYAYPFIGGATTSLVAFNTNGITTAGFLSTASSTINASTTITGILTLSGATTTALKGFDIQAGCFSILGTCLQTTITGSSAYKQAVKYASTSTLPSNVYNNGASGVGATLTGVANGAFYIDGNTPSVGDRVLVKNESTGANNGIYTVTTLGVILVSPYVLTRATDYNSAADVFPGVANFTNSGTVNANTCWVLSNSTAIVIGTTALTYDDACGSGSFTGTAPIAVSGTTISLNYNTAGLDFDGTNLISQLATSSVPTSGQLAAFTTIGTPTKLAGVSTTTLTLSGLDLTLGTLGALVGGVNATISAQVGTSSVPTAPSLAYWTSAGTPSNLGSVATTSVSAGTGISLSAGAGALVGGSALTITNSGVTSLGNGTGTTCTGTAPGSCSLAAITANSVLANNTSGSAIPVAVATSTMMGPGTNGQVLALSNGTAGWVATSTLANITGTLAIAKGGTATTTFYNGGVNFWDTTLATITQGRAIKDLFFDIVNARLGIGTSSPVSSLTVGSGTASSSATLAEYAYGASGNNATSTAATISPTTSSHLVWPIGTVATTLTLCNFQPGQTLTVRVVNPVTTAGALTWAVCAGYQLYWPTSSTIPTQTTTGTQYDIWSFIASANVGSTTRQSDIIISGAQTAAF